MGFTLEESVELPPIPAFDDGEILDAEVASAKVVDAPWDDDDNPGQKAKQVEFIFELPGHTVPGKDGGTFTRKIYGNTSTKFTTSSLCKLRAWVTEIMAVDELPAGYNLELDNLIGNPCKVVVNKKSWEDKKAPMQADGTYPIKEGNRVTDVLRAGPTQFAAPSYDDAYDDSEPF